MQSPFILKVALLTAKLHSAKSEFSTGSTGLGVFLANREEKNQLSQKCCIKVSGLKMMKKGKAELP